MTPPKGRLPFLWGCGWDGRCGKVRRAKARRAGGRRGRGSPGGCRTAGSDTGAGTLTEEEEVEEKGEGQQHPGPSRGADRVLGRRSSTWQGAPRGRLAGTA